MASALKMNIAGRAIGPGSPPYVIAEMSANHNGSLDNARRIISQASLCGADAVKLQTYTPDTITFNGTQSDFQIQDGPWSGRSLYELYQDAHMPWSWHKPLFEHAKIAGIQIFSSPFDSSAVDLLEDLNAPAYKIASFEIIDLPLIAYAASTKKPLIISTGMASFDEMAEAVEVARQNGCNELALLHCVSGYPTPPDQYHLATMAEIREKFNVLVGLSDHTISNTTAVTAVALGASVVEKHFTLDRSQGGPDDSFSIQPEELKELCVGLKAAFDAVGTVKPDFLEVEQPSKKHRRSLFFVSDLAAGDIITSDAVKSIRPGSGLPPKYLENVVGLTVKKDVTAGTPVSFDLIS